MKIKTGDNVKVISGSKEMKGKTGKVIQVIYNEKNQQTYIVLEGVNIRKKHIRPHGGHAGQVIELPGPIHVSNVMMIDPKAGTPTRVGFQIEGKTKKRIAKKSKEFID
ncbi:MAG: 50S ribosomal protein L24 [Candidatus Magasanikbacteria bacterium CG10_big_fil_rev_8_21_14_0_10_47_10]|uniref:Large ribosomal subunit protein uL24 n=1 Tax=Candidatus Magasanikbacteria bacterium CG10_big_fil_rev_8_21_14_0_10_47_10 TaxID=1974652 RepID=A0A2H0TP96_9BACT|nr:MAG: 50S ribosomal protein L24 [Candidatus Magasanikbacteria bacterium CG10_big_fil_rev_8_21_14_0_10_47_10]